MFSLQPTRTTRWHTRAITANERSALQAVANARQARLPLPHKQLQWRKATVVTAPYGKRHTVLVPDNVVRDVDGYYYAQRHYTFVRTAGRYAYRGVLPAKPVQYFDVDGDDLPEILVSEACDGWCESLWSVDKGVRKVADFGGH